MRASIPLALCAVLLSPCFATAQSHAPALGTNASGLRGLVHTGLPLTAPELNLSATVGYGLTEAIAPVAGAHHRAEGSLGAAIAPLPWLAFALRLDGRLERHPDDGGGAHSAAFGDPRLFARVGHALSPALSVGLELGLWFPGENAPSLSPGATTVDARALFALTPEDSPWVVLSTLGFRLDNSGDSAPDLTRLRLGDRVSLGLSDSNALLAAVGVARRFGNSGELFTELSADLLLGDSAPDFIESPLRAAFGGRYFIARRWQLELTAIAALSSRPAVTAADPLVPIEPRILVITALRYHIDVGKAEDNQPSAAPSPPPPLRASPEPAPEPAPAVHFGDVAGVLVDDGGAPLPETKVTLNTQDGKAREAITDAEGRYVFTEVPLGPAALRAEATGFATQTWEIDVQPGIMPVAARALAPKAETGVLRGLIRSFDSAPLRAQIAVHDLRGRSIATAESSQDGRFELELPPGRYRVTIRAPGFRTHSRTLKIEDTSVAILNVDMRQQK